MSGGNFIATHDSKINCPNICTMKRLYKKNVRTETFSSFLKETQTPSIKERLLRKCENRGGKHRVTRPDPSLFFFYDVLGETKAPRVGGDVGGLLFVLLHHNPKFQKWQAIWNPRRHDW